MSQAVREVPAECWISVKDEMPPKRQTVIVAGGIAYWDGVDWITETGHSNGRMIQWAVTHWMPLLHPPIGDGSGKRAA